MASNLKFELPAKNIRVEAQPIACLPIVYRILNLFAAPNKTRHGGTCL